MAFDAGAEHLGSVENSRSAIDPLKEDVKGPLDRKADDPLKSTQGVAVLVSGTQRETRYCADFTVHKLLHRMPRISREQNGSS